MNNKKTIFLLLIVASVFSVFIISVSIFYNPKFTKSEKEVSIKKIKKVANLPDRGKRDEILFGCSISQTGYYKSEGESVIQGYDLWVNKVNSEGGLKVNNKRYPVRIIYYDDQSMKESVRENIEKLIHIDKVDFLLGPYSSGLTLVASKLAEKYGKILIETCGASEKIFSKDNQFTFGVLTTASWYLKDYFEMISKRTSGNLTFAVISVDNIFSKSVAKGARIWGSRFNFNELFYEEINMVESSWSQVKKLLQENKPDIVVFAGHYQKSIQFIKEVEKIKNFEPKSIVTTLGASQKDFVKDLGTLSENITGISQWVPEANYNCPYFESSERYAEIFKQKYNHIPSYQNAAATSGCLIYQLAIEKSKSLNAQEVLKNIREINTELFYGKFKFNSRGMNVLHSMVVIQIQEGKQRLVYPENLTNFDFVYPIYKK